ncbi:pirin family protein [Thermophagus sp. OGC60D27]|uniref:pirin family protein n=1 Tax=Thermophagus sp. OGC60D27 TaxID=3458415 RepID=UPI0040382CAC
MIEKYIKHKSESRGHANHGWLDTYHTFSFANYYNPARMGFGALRVLNDDTVEAGKGFGMHPHDNMEIISIPLEGDLEHKDNMGNASVIKSGDVQVMSAGTGVLHGEKNKNSHAPVKFLQIWVVPNKRNVAPRYDQMTFDKKGRENKLQQILSHDPDDEGVWIYQDAWFHLGDLDKDFSLTYSLKRRGNGVYVFVLTGKISIGNHALDSRDGLGIIDAEEIEIKANIDAEILLMEVPMSF